MVAEGLARLVGARHVVYTGIELDPPRGTVLADRGWGSAAEREHWLRYPEILDGFRESGLHRRFVAMPGARMTRDRAQLVPDDEWHGSAEYNEIYRVLDFGSALVSYARVDGGRALLGLGMCRPHGGTGFGARERRLLRVFHAELDRHLDRSLFREASDPFAALPPRLRRTLECLLEGDNAGQAARRLGLSRHTVYQYVAALYRQFEVRGRGELLAHCHRLRPRAGGDGRPSA